MDGRDLTIGARVLARGLHAGSTDARGRGLGEALAELAARVGESHGERHPAVAVAWLHLSLEQVTEAELAASFGEEIASAVSALTPPSPPSPPCAAADGAGVALCCAATSGAAPACRSVNTPSPSQSLVERNTGVMARSLSEAVRIELACLRMTRNIIRR